jgi:hypothetical protein
MNQPEKHQPEKSQITTPEGQPKPKPPRSAAQIEASRANGAKSNGPVTAQGKHRSSQNAILHGLTATEHTLLMTEDPVQYKEVVEAFIDDLRPATKAELRLVEKLANLDWRLERFVMMETCVLNMEVGVNADKIMERFSRIDGIGFIVEAWKESLTATRCLDLLRRYLATLQHQFNTTFSNFQKFETRRLARKNNRDLDPEMLPPYQRPRLDSFDPAESEPLNESEEEAAAQLPEEAGKQNEPEKSSRPAIQVVTQLDTKSQTRKDFVNKNQDPRRPAA